MHRVMRHIDDHLDAQLELDSLAAVANFSPFHFHLTETGVFECEICIPVAAL